MEKDSVTLEKVVIETTVYLKKMGLSKSRISQYQAAWNHLKTYMSERGEPYFSASVTEAFIYDLLGDQSFDDLKSWQKQIISCVNVLTEYMETQSIKFKRGKKFRVLKGAIGLTILEYIRHRKNMGISESTAEEYRYHLSQWLTYLNDHGMNILDKITKRNVIDYANSTVFASSNTRHRNLSILKGYLRNLYDNQLISTDLSAAVPKSKKVRQPKLPSTYSIEEVDALIAAIDRSSPKGKRDYAMVLLAARLGLRATDVCDLKFESFHWEQNLLVIKQSKTGEWIQLPLLKEIGDSVVDYLKYARPQSELPYVFLRVVSPHDRLNISTFYSIVCQYMRLAGIKSEHQRKRGPHALRHSLAGILLEKKTPVPVIAEVLGHLSVESTRSYLSIDMDALQQCALDVPPISTPFYEGRVDV